MSIGVSVKLLQKNEFIQDLQEINRSIQKHQAEIKLVSAERAKEASSLESQQARLKKATELLSDQSAKCNLLTTRLGEMQKAQKDNNLVLQSLKKSYDAELEKLKLIGTNLGKNSKEYAAQREVVQSLARKVEVSTNNYNRNQAAIDGVSIQLTKAQTAYIRAQQDVDKLTECIRNNSSTYKAAQTQISSQKAQLNALKEQYVGVALTQGKGSAAAEALGAKISSVSAELSQNREKLEAAKNAANKFDSSISNAGQAAENSAGRVNIAQAAITGLAVTITTQGVAALKEFVRNSINVGAEFEAVMSKVEAISGGTATEMYQLSEKAVELGKNTKFTSREVGEAYSYMAMAGWKSKAMLEGIDGVMQLAAVSGSDLGKTSDIVTDTITALGLQASDSGRLVDVLAAAASNSNTNVDMMGLTFQYVAPLAGSLHMSMEDLAFSIGLMANSGVKADKAGVALRNILTRLIDPTKSSEAWIRKLGLRIRDSRGDVVSLRDIIDQLRVKMKGLSNAEQAEAASALAGKHALSGLLALVNAAPGDYEKLSLAIEDSSGAAQRMSEVMLNNGQGALTLLSSKFEALQISAYRRLKPAFESAIKFANDFIDALDWCVDHTKTVASAIGTLVATAGTAKVLVPLFRQLKEAMTLKGEDDKRSLFTRISQGLFKMSGWEVAITAVVAIVGALKTAYDNHQEYLESLKVPDEWVQKQAEAADAVKQSWESLEETRKKATDKAKTEELLNKQLLYELQAITDNNGKIKQGYEDRAKFIADKLEDSADIEIKITNGIIKNYQKLTGEIHTLIESKRAQAILNAQEGKYNEALENQAQTYENIHKTEIQIHGVEAKILEISQRRTKLIEKFDSLIAEGKAKNQKTYGLEVTKGIKLQPLNDELVKAYSNLNGLQKTYDTHKNMAKEYAYTITTYQKNQAEFAAKHYNNLTELNWNYVHNAQKAGSVEAANLIGQINKTEDSLATLRHLKEEHNTNIYDKDIENAERMLKQYKDNLKQYIDTTKTGGEQVQNIIDEEMQKTIEKLIGAKVTYTQAADGNITAYINGVKVKEGKLYEVIDYLMAGAREKVTNKNESFFATGGKTTEAIADGMKSRLDAMHAAAKALANGGILEFVKYQIQARKAGNFVARGFTDGMTEWKTNIDKCAFALGKNALSALKRGCDERSPSRTARKYGRFVAEGLTLGIQDDMKGAMASAAELGTSTLKALEANIDTSKLRNLESHVDVSNFKNSGGQYSADFNTMSSLIMTQFKMFTDKLDSRFEDVVNGINKLAEKKLELNGNVVGEFIDHRMEKTFYY